MITVRQLIDRLSQFDENEIVTIDAYNDDGSAEADVYVGSDCIAGLVDYYNSTQIELV